MKFDIITIFPKIFDSYFGESILKRAQEKNIIKINIHNLRDYSDDRHKKVDDRPYGGGPGMVMMVEPIFNCVKKILKAKKKEKTRVILFSTRGEKFDNKIAKRLIKYKNLILICGRYEGIDERVAQYVADEEISIGEYVLTGGELPAMILVDAVSRHIPGILGKYESLEEVSGSHVSYTRPEVFEIMGKSRSGKKIKKRLCVPKILMSGDHKKIEEWRNK